MSLAEKSLKPNSKNSQKLDVPTWSDWIEISKQNDTPDATKGMKSKATPPKGKVKGKQATDSYETLEHGNLSKDNVGAKYNSKNKSNVGLPKTKGIGKTWVEDDFKKNPLNIKEAVSYIDQQYQMDLLMESPENEFGQEPEEKTGATSDFGGGEDFGGEEDLGDELGGEPPKVEDSGLSVSPQYVQDLLSSKSSKIETDSIKVTEVSSEGGDDFGSQEGDFDSFGGEEDTFGSEGETNFDTEEEEVSLESFNFLSEGDEEDFGETEGDEQSFESPQDSFEEPEMSSEEDLSAEGGEEVLQTLTLSFDVKSLTKGDSAESKELTLEVIQVDPQEKTCKVVLKDGESVNVESEVKKCNSTSNVESLVKEVINKYFNTSDPKSESMSYTKKRGRPRKVKTETTNIKNIPTTNTKLKEKGVKTEAWDEDDDILDRDWFEEPDDYDDPKYAEEDERANAAWERLKSSLSDEDDEEFNVTPNSTKSSVSPSELDDEEFDEDDLDDENWWEDDLSEEFEEFEESTDYADLDEDPVTESCGDPMDEELEIKQENLFLEYASRQGLDEAAGKELYEMFKEAVNSKIASEKVKLENKYQKLYKEGLKLAESRMVENADKFLTHITEEWKNENKLVLAESIKRNTSDKILNKVLKVLTEGNIVVPETEVKVSKVFKQKNAQYKERVNQLLEENISLKKEIRDNQANLKRASIFLEETSGLSEMSKDKLRVLLENVDYTSESAYRNKVRSLKSKILPSGNKSKSELQRKTLAESAQTPRVVSVDVNGQSDYINQLSNLLYAFKDPQR